MYRTLTDLTEVSSGSMRFERLASRHSSDTWGEQLSNAQFGVPAVALTVRMGNFKEESDDEDNDPEELELFPGGQEPHTLAFAAIRRVTLAEVLHKQGMYPPERESISVGLARSSLFREFSESYLREVSGLDTSRYVYLPRDIESLGAHKKGPYGRTTFYSRWRLSYEADASEDNGDQATS